MTKVGRPITCECLKLDTCKTCYNRVKRRAWVEKNRAKERAQNAEHQASRLERLKQDPAAYAAYRAKRNAQKRAAYKLTHEQDATRGLTITELGEDRLYTIDEWLETFGPIGSHGNYFHPLIA
ncbi:MAG: hypothetical protein ACR2JV_02005 [Gaiellales bacterium]